MSYRFADCPDLLRTSLIELARSQQSPWFADLHFHLARKEDWKPRVFTDADRCRHALNIVTAWAIGARAIAKTVDDEDATLNEATSFLGNLAADLELQLLELEPQPQDVTAN
jgi:hypothetical protein